MRQQPDEFAVPDIRHFMAEAWRIVRHRRWHFVIAFLIAGTLAFAGSMFVPRKYSATTILKRESDPALAGMAGKGWTERYAEIRQQMTSDLGDLEMIKSVLRALGKSNRGSIEPLAPPAEQEARRVSEGLVVKSLESSASRDVVSLTLTLPNGRNLPQILEGIRDRYVEKTRSKTTEILRGLEQFFVIQTEKSRSELDAVRREISECERQFPGVNPDGADPSQTEQAALAVDRMSVQGQRDAMEQQRQALDDELRAFDQQATAVPSTQDGVRTAAFRSICVAVSDVPDIQQNPNPRFADLQSQKEKLSQEIAENKALKAMTNQHPVIARLRDSMEAVDAELENTPEFLPNSQSGTASITQHQEKFQLRRQIADIDARLKVVRTRQDEIQHTTDRLQRNRLLAAEHREGFLKLRQKAERIEADVNSWQQNIAPIRRLLTLENSNRGLHFTAVGSIESSGRPVFPAIWMLFAGCLGIATASGVLTIIAVELLDRSFRTARQLAALGVPLIRMIDEIVTRETQQSRVVRRLVVLPSLVLILLAALLSAGSLAIISLDEPGGGVYQEVAASREPYRLEVTDRSNRLPDASDDTIEMGD